MANFFFKRSGDHRGHKGGNIAAHARYLAHQGGSDRANLRRRRQKHGLYGGRHGGIHAGHLHLVIEVTRIAQTANEDSRSGPLRGRHDEIAERGADDFAAGTAPKRGRDLSEHGEPFLGRKQRRLAGMDADGEHQAVGQPHGAPHHVKMAVGNGVERPGKERGARHGGGLAREPHSRKAVVPEGTAVSSPSRNAISSAQKGKCLIRQGSEKPVTNASRSADTKIVRRRADAATWRVAADICIVGGGIAGTSAALTAARAGRTGVLVDGLPVLGGQAVNSIIGTFCGLFANGTHGHQFTHGIADDILRDLGAKEHALHYRHGPLTTVVYV